MPRYKIVATGPIKIEPSVRSERVWVAPAVHHDKIISVAGVLWEDIPKVGDFSFRRRGMFGRTVTFNGEPALAIRSSLTLEDFEVEIVNA
jgi:hypothetical protein